MIEPTVLFAADLTGDEQPGLALATRLAVLHGATLLILHVAPLRAADGEGMLHAVLDLGSGRAEQQLRRLIPTDSRVPYKHLLEAGEPEQVIAEVARRERAELIVLACKPRSALRAAFSRHLAEKVLALAPCPVVTCRPEGHADESLPPADMAPVFAEPTQPHAALSMLDALLSARVAAVGTWMDQRREAVARVAASAEVRDGVASLLRRAPSHGADATRDQLHTALALALSEHQHALGALGVSLVVGGEALLAAGPGTRPDGARTRFEQRVCTEGSAISLPLDAETGRPGHDYVILAGAQIALQGLPDVMLIFTLDARTDFLRILGQPGPTASTETYAFDADGLMLSNSRFPQQLRRMGLLPAEPGVQTPRRLWVREPRAGDSGADPDALQPLTRMAAAATQGHDGSDIRGYLDYRGVRVVGAWRWVARHGFGVAAEMDLRGR